MRTLTKGGGIAVSAIAALLSPHVLFGQVHSVSQLSCNPGSLSSGATATCTVTLNTAAPAGGTQVSLSSNTALLALSANSVTVQAGAASATFTATASNISGSQNATLTATALNSVGLSWNSSVSPNLADYRIYRGVTSGGPYNFLTSPGLADTYTDYNVQAGQSYYYVATAVNTAGVESGYSDETAASLPSAVLRTATIGLTAPQAPPPVTLSSLACSPTSIGSGATTTCTVALSGAAQGNTVVSLSSNNSLLPVQGSVTVPGGSSSATFSAVAGSISSYQSATLTAILGGVSQTATVSLTTHSGGRTSIGFVQVAAATPQSPTQTVSVTFPGSQTASNLNVVVVGWNDNSASVQSVSDSMGNSYNLAIGPTSAQNLQQSIYYASHIAGGNNTVTVTFSRPAVYADVRILEYSGVSTLQATAAESGDGPTANSGSVTTTGSRELLVAANTVATGNSGASSGFSTRIITLPDSDIVEDGAVTTAGAYSATAALVFPGSWVMQIIALQ